MKKQKNKLKINDKLKIQARFQSKYDEFIKLPLNDEVFEGVIQVRGLKTVYKEDKMSSTDKYALIQAINYVLENNRAKIEGNRIDQLEEIAKNESDK